MYKEKCESIANYLSEEFPESAIEHAEIAESQHYRINVNSGLLLLKVSREFIDDHSIDVMLEMFKQWKISCLLRDNHRQGILVTNAGTCIFNR